MINLVISGWVIVTGHLFIIWRLKSSVTDPRDTKTLPKRTEAKIVLRNPRKEWAAATILSANNLLAPRVFVGLIALSVLILITRSTFFSNAASITFCVPSTFVFTTSNGLYSQAETCLRAAACKTK